MNEELEARDESLMRAQGPTVMIFCPRLLFD